MRTYHFACLAVDAFMFLSVSVFLGGMVASRAWRCQAEPGHDKQVDSSEPKSFACRLVWPSTSLSLTLSLSFSLSLSLSLVAWKATASVTETGSAGGFTIRCDNSYSKDISTSSS